MHRVNFRLKVGCALFLALLTSIAGLAAAEPSGQLIIFHAGSLTEPFKVMEEDFEAKHPGVEVVLEGGGSTKMAKMISELDKAADIMASADYRVIDTILVPEFADWNIRFATNQLVLCYTDDSRFAEETNAENWFEILQRKDVVWGHSDPNLDPCGYRALMVLQLAEIYYNMPGLYRSLLTNRPEGNVRPKAAELVSLLGKGEMDYAWEYLSVAVQHKLKYLALPEEINLGSHRFDDLYEKAQVKVTGKKPGTTVVKTGRSCTYGVTMIKSAVNAEAALAFLEYLLDPDGGLKILEQMGQPPLAPARVPTDEMKSLLPARLRALVEVAS